MTRVVFLASGGGGTMRFLHRCIQEGRLPDFELVGVVADRDCGALTYAGANGLPHRQIHYRRDDNAAMLATLAEWRPDVVITNIHRILDAELVATYRGKLVNLHYSLLPAFKGLIGVEPVRQALAHGCRFVGTTVHLVEEEVDAGPIVAQSVVPVTTDDLDALMDQVFRSGCLNLLNALQALGRGEPPPGAEPPGWSFSPAPAFAPSAFGEAFWGALR
ncbi:MAG: phosphoribosylglycinamide formyltransferase [Candidatus Sericytochromatia bacterium]